MIIITVNTRTIVIPKKTIVLFKSFSLLLFLIDFKKYYFVVHTVFYLLELKPLDKL